jgi:hypothetical protein
LSSLPECFLRPTVPTWHPLTLEGIEDLRFECPTVNAYSHDDARRNYLMMHNPFSLRAPGTPPEQACGKIPTRTACKGLLFFGSSPNKESAFATLMGSICHNKLRRVRLGIQNLNSLEYLQIPQIREAEYRVPDILLSLNSSDRMHQQVETRVRISNSQTEPVSELLRPHKRSRVPSKSSTPRSIPSFPTW